MSWSTCCTSDTVIGSSGTRKQLIFNSYSKLLGHPVNYSSMFLRGCKHTQRHQEMQVLWVCFLKDAAWLTQSHIQACSIDLLWLKRRSVVHSLTHTGVQCQKSPTCAATESRVNMHDPPSRRRDVHKEVGLLIAVQSAPECASDSLLPRLHRRLLHFARQQL